MPKVWNVWIGSESLPPTLQENMIVQIPGDSAIRIKKSISKHPGVGWKPDGRTLYKCPA